MDKETMLKEIEVKLKVVNKGVLNAEDFSDDHNEEIEEYLDTGEPFDKAGAYGVQGFGARYIKNIDGDYYAVVGLPVHRLYRELYPLLHKNEL